MASLLDFQSLLSGVAVASLALIWMAEGGFPFFPPSKHRWRHAGKNLLFALVNGGLVAGVFAGLTAAVAAWAADNGYGLAHRLNWTGWLSTLLLLVLFDGWMYLWHRANHAVPLLWRFHRMHHSDTNVDVTTASRFHPGEIFLSSLARMVVVPLLGMSVAHLLLYELVLLPVVQFHHSNVALPERWDRWLRLIIVSPNMHRVHHSNWQPETDSNYSSVLSVWDRLFGSFRWRENTRTLAYGLEGWEGEKRHTVPSLLLTPFFSEDDSPNSVVASPDRQWT